MLKNTLASKLKQGQVEVSKVHIANQIFFFYLGFFYIGLLKAKKFSPIFLQILSLNQCYALFIRLT